MTILSLHIFIAINKILFYSSRSVTNLNSNTRMRIEGRLLEMQWTLRVLKKDKHKFLRLYFLPNMVVCLKKKKKWRYIAIDEWIIKE